MTTPLKILHVIGDLDAGGAQTMLANLAMRMDKKKFLNSVATLSGRGTWGGKLAAAGVAVHEIGTSRKMRPVGDFWKLLRLLRQEKPDIVQGWMYYANFAVTVESFFQRAPSYVWNIRCSDMDDAFYSTRARRVKNFCAKLSGFPNAVVVNSDSGKTYHEKIGFTPRHWEMIPNGFDTDLFRPDKTAREKLRREWKISPNVFLIGMAARFDPMKDHTTFFKAVAFLLKKRSDVRFVLCGKGVSGGNPEFIRLAEEVEVRAACLFLDVWRDMPSFYAALDVASLSSAFGEGFPNALGEAMACGIPCVATDTGDCRALIDAAGSVAHPGSAKALAEEWDKILSMTEEKRSLMGSFARKRIEENYSMDRIVERYSSFYRDLAVAREG